MPVRHWIDPVRRRLVVVGEGEVTPEERDANFREIVSHPDFGPGFDVLIDLSPQDTVVPTEEVHREVERIESVRERFPFRRLAAVGPTPVQYGVLRMFAALNEKSFLAVGVFRSREEAERWLDEADG